MKELVTDAANNLVRDGYMVGEDVPAVVTRALATWDELTRGTPMAGK